MDDKSYDKSYDKPYDWSALLERIETGMTTASDADRVRDLLDWVIGFKSMLLSSEYPSSEQSSDGEE